MAEAVVSIALETIRDLLLEEARFLSGVGGKVKVLQTQLKEMKCLLEDADKRQHEIKSVGNWISQIKDLACRAEDAIEMYAFRVSSKRQRPFKHLLRRFSCVLKQGHSLHQIGSEISSIESEIARVTKSMQEYGIKSIIQGEGSTSDKQQWKRQTFPFEIEDCFVGKEDELKRLLSLIVNDEQHRVISIWGMGGIGKTTIARKVYNHVDTRRRFESFAWVCITKQCQSRSVLEDVLKQLNPLKRDAVSSLSLGELIDEIRQIQEAKRCIIVLDDLWKVDDWDALKIAFLFQGSISKILLTTRNLKVVDHVGFPIEVGILNVDDGWELLKKKAFPHDNITDSAIDENSLSKIGKDIVSKCDYLPLAISLVGGVLRKNKSVEEWNLVNENIKGYLYEGLEKEKEIHGVLNLSYEDLPYYLKPCFLYMGQFREEEFVFADDLYRMWIAHGMISHENQGRGESLMDIAEVYLSELASRCIVQVEVEDVNAIRGRKFRSCKLHDVVRELCLSLGKKEDFCVQILDYKGGKFSTLLHESLSTVKTRYLDIHFESEIELELEQGELTVSRDEDTVKHVRSLQFLNLKPRETIEFPHIIVDLQKFKLLRGLVFLRFNFSGRELPRGIGNLIHLRYLRLRECKLDQLPSSISNLVYLHTLDLLHSSNVRVPNVLKKMFRLKHLLLPSYDKEKIGNYQLRLDEGLDELETLYWFDSSVHELKSVTRMKKLRCFAGRVRDNESLSEIINAITTSLNNLRYCAVFIDPDCQFTSVEEGLMNFKKVFRCPDLHRLTINVKIGKLLVECENQVISSKLVHLTLSNSEIEDDPMEILGKLPFLVDLRLFARSFVGQEMKCHTSGFPRLNILVLKGLPNLREWRVEKGAMPLLSEIEINDCPHLKMLPDGLRFIDTLQKLTITGMPELGKRVSDEDGEDFNKVRQIPSIIINSGMPESGKRVSDEDGEDFSIIINSGMPELGKQVSDEDGEDF